MKNYYEILEVSPKASQEMISKAYKVLVKRYHPDLQTSQEAKEKCEVKIKEINEAYDVIGDEQKRKEYDVKLEAESQKIKSNQEQNQDYRTAKKTNYNSSQSNNQVPNNNQNVRNNTNSNSYDSIKDIHARAQERMRQRQDQRQQEFNQQQMNQEYQKQYQDAINKAYHDAYIQDLKNRGYKIKYKKTFNDYLRSMVALLITIGIIAMVVQIPFVKDFLHSLYEENPFIKGIVDSIANLFR